MTKSRRSYLSPLPPAAPIPPSMAPHDLVIEGDPEDLLGNPDVPASRAPRLSDLPARPRIQRRTRA